MKDQTRDQLVQQLRTAFKTMPRPEREKAILEIIKGIHSLSGAVLAGSTNDTFMTLMSVGVDEYVVDSLIVDDLLSILAYLNYPALMMSLDYEKAKEVDMNMPVLCRNVENSYQHIRTAFNKICLYTNVMDRQNVITDVVDNVVTVDFKNKKK